jgi:hypothetical protein
MNQTKGMILLPVLLLLVLVAACTPASNEDSLLPLPAATLQRAGQNEKSLPGTVQKAGPTQSPTAGEELTQTETTASQSSSGDNLPPEELAREDSQGAVVVIITPLNLDNPGETLDFDVKMDTHSVDLSMDLSTLSFLTNDIGLTVQPVKWDAPMGGHHVAGTLTFPSSADGVSFLDGVKTMTLTIKNVDVPLRTFTWQPSAE